MSDNFDLNLPDETKRDSFFSKAGRILTLIFSKIAALFGFLPRKLRIILTIILITAVLVILLIASQPRAEKRPSPETVVTVEVIEAMRADYPIIVNTNGTVQADIRGNLVSQIRGEIVNVSDSFKNGGAFNAGDVLIEVDQRDYIAEVSQALSSVSQAKASLQQEQALAKQAQTDWKRLGNKGKPPTLVAREPQLAAARAQMQSAEARYQTAQLNLERTKITAPYTGRVIRRNAVLGQYVSIGTNLAEIFATDEVEVRLPLSQDEYIQLGLDQLGNDDAPPFSVEVTSQVGTSTHTWQATVTRTDSTFDLTTRQIDVIAEVIDPFSTVGNKPPLKIGQFINASIQGRTLVNVISVPNKSLREGSYVFTSQNNKLVRTPVTLTWQDDKNAVIESGLENGDTVVVTSLNSTLAGATVKYQEADNTPNAPESEVPAQPDNLAIPDTKTNDDHSTGPASADASSQ